MANDEGKMLDKISWVVPEYEKHERSRNWYIISGVVAVIFLGISLYTMNLLFGFIVIIASIIMIIHDGREPEKIQVTLTGEGVYVGRSFFDYDNIENFCVLFKPKDDVRRLYFEFKSSIKQRLSLPLDSMDPLQIREFLLQYLSEDLERLNPPLSEQLARLLKL